MKRRVRCKLEQSVQEVDRLLECCSRARVDLRQTGQTQPAGPVSQRQQPLSAAAWPQTATLLGGSFFWDGRTLASFSRAPSLFEQISC